MSVFTIKQGDTSPAIQHRLQEPSGEDVDLTNATVEFVMQRPETAEVVVKSAEILEPENGLVFYSWDESDTALPGIMRAEWRAEFTMDDGSGGIETFVETFPNVGYIKIHIPSDLRDYNDDE